MKEYPPFLLVTITFIGCESAYLSSLKEVPVYPINVKQGNTASKTPADETGQPNSHLASDHWSGVSKVCDEATRLSYQASQGKVTKVQAAQYLNRFRIQLVGRDSADDSMYEVYLRPAMDSQRGEISTSQFKLYIQSALRDWQQRWKSMTNKSFNPTFTNSLTEVMGMTSLQ